MKTYNTIIIGAGASGLMAAAYTGANTLIIDHNAAPGKKILVSGGGNCNFSNKNVTAQDYKSANPHFCKSALAGFTPQDFINILNARAVRWEEREGGKLFAFNAKDILNMLLERAKDSAQFAYTTKVYSVEKTGEYFTIKTSGPEYRAKNVIVASGGLSMPRIGASALAHEIAASFGLGVTPIYPALSPYLWNQKEQDLFAPLAGVSCSAQLTCGKIKIKDAVLFTHYGLSGPGALQMSLWSRGGEEISMNFLPGFDIPALIETGRKGGKFLSSLVPLPQRLVQTLMSNIEAKAAEAKKETLLEFERRLTNYKFTPQVNDSYQKAEITAGGVDTREINSADMQCRKVPGLYFTGECLDVSGRLGGYNLHWAWASGAAAGKAIAAK